ncbi:hypothetical protein LVJ94_28325 [Pendulispora rubella]|uniref:Uncharacterized protein n=1 Tax=Pendulispora rubella TaxID=2741070 RepID=A0ABZ2KQ73_9BACT
MRLPFLSWIPFALATVASSAHAQKPQEPPQALPPLPPPPPTTPVPPAPPASAAPPATPPAPPGDAEGFDVQLTATARNLQFHLWTDEGRFVKVCTMPCRAPFFPGKYYFALSEGSDNLVRLDPVDLKGASQIEATYVSRAGLRTAGLLTFIGSVGAGIAIGIAGSKETCTNGECKNEIPTGVGIAALGVAIVGGLTGLVMASRPDKIGIRVTAK